MPEKSACGDALGFGAGSAQAPSPQQTAAAVRTTVVRYHTNRGARALAGNVRTENKIKVANRR